MEEWGIWREGRGEWWTDKSGLVFHTTAKEVADAQLDHICAHWLPSNVYHLSVKSFQTGEVIRTRGWLVQGISAERLTGGTREKEEP